MRRRPRQISLKECYGVLKLEKNADMEAVKRAYRERAFELHPDLNPDNPEAGREFQLLNEAYVALSAALKHEEGVKEKAQTRRAAKTAASGDAGAETAAETENTRQSARAEAKKAPPDGKAKTAQSENAQQQARDAASARNERPHAAGPASEQEPKAENVRSGYDEHDVLRDLLNDPFARRVFEDIYSELNKQQANERSAENVAGTAANGTSASENGNTAPNGERTPEQPVRPDPAAARARTADPGRKKTKLHQGNLAWGTPKWNKEMNKGVTGIVKDWLRRQIDEEQSLTLPAANLAPGRRVRLQIRRGISGELATVEITLPPDFTVGKPVRLRGLGKRVGPWEGDLYLTLYNE